MRLNCVYLINIGNIKASALFIAKDFLVVKIINVAPKFSLK